jgi:hypothetical protein
MLSERLYCRFSFCIVSVAMMQVWKMLVSMLYRGMNMGRKAGETLNYHPIAYHGQYGRVGVSFAFKVKCSRPEAAPASATCRA